MKIDMPQCNLKTCRYCFDGNCTDTNKYGFCEYAEALQLWFQELKDIPYMIAETALRKWVNTSKWSPTIADIRELSSANANGEQADYGEAWQEVMKSVQRWGMYREEQALENMDQLTKQVVQRLGFRSICTSENITADRANFRMIFEELSSREKTNNQVPQKLREQIEQIRNAGVQKIENKGEQCKKEKEYAAIVQEISEHKQKTE